LILIFASIWYLEDRKVDSGSTDVGDTSIHIGMGMTAEEKASMYDPAQEISTPDGFINVETISVEGEIKKGNIVLVDFWTYSCINCQRTLPYLNAWHDRYGDKGLTIIGVHTPEFEFEKDIENVQRAVDEFDIKYPVVLDNDFSTWRAYQNRYWPRKYLVDIDGFIVYDHIGEGSYEETEEKIVELLEERAERMGESFDESGSTTPVDVDDVNFGQVRTPEIYFGYSRLQYLANLPDDMCFGKTCSYEFTDVLPENTFSLGGDWRIEEEQAVLVDSGGTIGLNFSASKVNIVAEAQSEPVTVEVFLDGKKTQTITVDDAKLYNVVDLKGNYGEHTLEIRVKGSGLSVFTFTFG